MRKALLTFALVVITPVVSHADAATDKAVQKTLKSLVGAIRYGKDDIAAKQVGFTAMAKTLLGDEWQKLPPAEQTELARGLETLVRAISFPSGKEKFQYLDAVLYEGARVEGDKAKVRSTIVIHRDLKKSEIIIDWVLVNEGGTWKVMDTIMLGESTLAGLRDEQVAPLLKQGGTPALMKALRDKVAEVKKT